MQINPDDRIVRIPEVSTLTGLGRSTIYTRIEHGLMPSPFPLGGQAVGWRLSEILAINNARTAGRSDDEIRELVARLLAERKTLHREAVAA